MDGHADHTVVDPLEHFVPMPVDDLRVAPLLERIGAQAESADRTRSVDPAVIQAVKANDFMRLSASRGLGGLEASVVDIGRELAAVAAQCPSLAWAMWNHTCVFHLFAGALGPDHIDFLASIVENHEWVSFPAGAGSGVHGTLDGNDVVLEGNATWATGARYGDWCGVVFAVARNGEIVRPVDLRFTMVRNTSDGVNIDANWNGAALRASATDEIHYSATRVPLDRCVPWFGANRAESLRTVPVVHHRFREDWVGLSDLWLGAMAVAVLREAVREATAAFRHRRALMGVKMVDRPTVQINLGRAASAVATAHAAVTHAAREVDERIAAEIVPTTADYLRQQAVVTMALEGLSDAADLIARSTGGNGLREGTPIERRLRDLRAMPLHINAHVDRITHQVGRYALGIELDPF